jgi:DNA-binding NtrC family response regulator
VHCAALPESLVESELFGHIKGSFSGAVANKRGLLDAAHGGTLFLDEIGEVSPTVQVKLLRALETGRVTPVGATSDHAVDARVVAATHRDLPAEVKAGRFREDLYYRLCAARVVVPPLRDRPREIALLARRFLDEACRRQGRPPLALSPEVLRAFASHDWPGNVRELRNLVEVAATTAADEVLELADLPSPIGRCAGDGAEPAAGAAAGARSEVPRSFRPVADEVADLERRRMIEALSATGGNQTRAAQLIGMPARTFVSKLKPYGIVSRPAPTGRR